MRRLMCVIAAAAMTLCPALGLAQSTGGGIRGSVISVNVRGGNNGDALESITGKEGTSGLYPVTNANWNEVEPNKKTVSLANPKDNIGVTTSATIEVTLGGRWYLTDLVTGDALTKRDERLGWMGRGYCDASENADTPELKLKGIPYAQYDVILYLATDNGNKKWAPATVTDAERNVTYYVYTGQETGTAATAVTGDRPANWQTNVSALIAGADTTGTYGRDVMRIAGLSGDVTIDTCQQHNGSNDPEARGGLCGFQIVDTTPPAFSVNFAKGGADGGTTVSAPVPDEATPFGLHPVAGSAWNNCEEARGTDITLKGSGVDATAKLTYAANDTWSYAEGVTDPFLKTFLGDSDHDGIGGATIAVSEIPFSRYDVIVYYATNTEDTQFLPVTVNGTRYTWDAAAATVATEDADALFGATRAATAAYGTNALRIADLSGNLTIQGSKQQRETEGDTSSALTNRGNIAAFQIVCTGEIIDPTPPAVISLNFATGGGGNVKTSAVSELSGDFGLVPAPAETWVDLTTASNSTGQTITTLHGQADENWQGATVTWNAKNAWSYQTGQVNDGTEPFLKTYLDDGDPGASVNIANLPFAAYDVIVYNATDAGKAFRPMSINNTWYTWEAGFGTIPADTDALDADVYGPNVTGGVSGFSTAALGTNALRVNGLTDAALAIQGRAVTITEGTDSDTYARGGLAAVQIVERHLITVSGEQAWADLVAGLSETDPILVVFERGATVTGDVTLPADAIIDLTACDLTAGVPFGGALAVNGGTVVRLPAGFTSGQIAATLSGTLGGTLVGGVPVWLTLDEEAGTLAAKFLWVDATGNHLWSDPGNWLSLIVPTAGSDVFFDPAASRAEQVILDVAAEVASLTIKTLGEDAATLTIDTQAGGALTVAGRMLVSGNVAVTQNANITVNGTSETYTPMPGFPTQPVWDAFQVHTGSYTVAGGTLTAMDDAGGVGVSGGGSVTVGGGTGAAMLAARTVRATYYDQNSQNAKGAIRLATNGTFAPASTVSLISNLTFTADGGTIRAGAESVVIAVSSGMALNGDTITVEALDGNRLELRASAMTPLFSGNATVTARGTVLFTAPHIDAAITDAYTGELIVDAKADVTLGMSRPNLSVGADATLRVTPTTGEKAIGEIVFPTSMTATPTGATFTVADVTEAVTPTVANGTLTLSWDVALPTLSQTGSWSDTGKWTQLTGETAPATGTAILDGTAAPITVKLDTALSGMTTILVRGGVTLATTDVQTGIPRSVTLTEGATLTVSAGFSGISLQAPWSLPAGTTLRVNKADFTGFAYMDLAGLLEFLPSGTESAPITLNMDKANFDGGLKVSGSHVTLENIGSLGGAVTLTGNDITLTGIVEEGDYGSVFHCTSGTRVVNEGEGNRITNLGGATGIFTVRSGSFAVQVVKSPLAGLAFIVNEGAILTFADGCVGGQYPISGAGTVDLGTLRPQVAAFTDGETTYATFPAHLKMTATETEQTAGSLSLTVAGNGVTLPAGGEVSIVSPTGEAWAVAPERVTNQQRIVFHNVAAPAWVPEALADEARAALAEAGVYGAVTLQVTTGGQTVTDAPEAVAAAALACFALEPTVTAGENGAGTVALAYEFGIAGLAPAADGGVAVTVGLRGGTFRAGTTVAVLGADGEPLASTTIGENPGASATVTIPADALGAAQTLRVRVSTPTP